MTIKYAESQKNYKLIEEQPPINLLTAGAAHQYFFNHLKKRKELVGDVILLNNDRHMIVRVLPDLHGETRAYYVVYKKDVFRSFENNFSEFSQKNPEYKKKWEDGKEEIRGESMNPEWLQKAIEEGTRTKDCEISLVFIYPDGLMRTIHPKAFKAFAEFHELIRQQEKTNSYSKDNYTKENYATNETTYSIPVTAMKVIR